MREVERQIIEYNLLHISFDYLMEQLKKPYKWSKKQQR
jgi:hypothetical protein